ncbi:2-C-methyl-D-erythritol 4-phosphate cytidylyltransferase [Nibribacter koreensis]|uniref:2-C-methyl-D-erythritol 4-phosphate cytidylyltransferase n=1 Tax=Nibribacter koreensis TaxID=1084519 RepID=A0ABP8FM35_9BACT
MQEPSYPIYTIVVAGGTGSRMNAPLPKQFLPVAGLPVLMHTLLRFHAYNPAMPLVLVLPAAELATWKDLCLQYDFRVTHQVVAGGKTRFQSVQNGLAALRIYEDGVVAVHDGVRPFVTQAIIHTAFETAHELGTAVVSVALKDSIRRVTGNVSKAVNRNAYKLVQTPQCFRLPLLRRAYEQGESSQFTDDASVVEKFGHKIHLVEGAYQNIKLTTPEDMLLAEAILAAERSNQSPKQ